MINAAGKQALKNGGPPVTNCFAGRPLSALKPRFLSKFGADAGQGRAGEASRRKKQDFGHGRHVGNRTLTLSRHNRRHRGRHAFRLRLTARASGRAPDPWLRGSNSR